MADADVVIALQLMDKATAPMRTSLSIMEKSIDSLNTALSTSGSKLGYLGAIARTVQIAIVGLSTAAGTIGTQFNETIESSTVGIAALLSAQGKFTDAQGKELTGREKINAALNYSSDLVKQLQVDNLKTTATFEQLLNAFQVTLAPGLAKGLDISQIREYTLAMVQAATAMQVPLDQMAEETRSLLTGTITPRNTRIATALGITAEDVKKWEGNASGWFTWVMGRLDAFKQFGSIQGTTYAGMLSNTKDAISNILGAATKPFFEEMKGVFGEFYNYAVKVNEATNTISLNPELIDSVQLLNDSLRLALATGSALIKVLGAAGSAYSTIKASAVSVGESNAGFIGPELTANLDDVQRLERVKELMAQIIRAKELLDRQQNVGWARVFWQDMTTAETVMANFNKTLATSAIENFRAEMVKAGQDVSEIDKFLLGAGASIKRFPDDMGVAAEQTSKVNSAMDGVTYGIDKAAMSADEFKKKLQEISGINFDNIGRSLDQKLIEVNAKLQAASAGAKTGLQNITAGSAVRSAELDAAQYWQAYYGASKEVMDKIAEDRKKSDELGKKEIALFYKNEANKEARKKGSEPVDLTKVDQDILRFTERMAKMYTEVSGMEMDFEASRLESSGSFYAAEEIRMAKRAANQKASFTKEVADAEQAYTEMQQKLSGKKGSTPEAVAAVEGLRDAWEAAKKRAEEYGSIVDKTAQQDLEIFKRRQNMQGQVDLAQTNVTYAQLTGTMESQLKAQIALIQASKEEKLANANKDIPGLVDAYTALSDAQLKLAAIDRGDYGYFEAFRQGLKDATKDAQTSFQAIRGFGKDMSSELGSEFKTFFSSALKGELKTAEDYFSAFCDAITNAFSNALSNMMSKWMESQITSLFSSIPGIGSLFGGSSASKSAIWQGAGLQDYVFMPGLWHSGGIVGDRAPSYRTVSSRIFANAPRLHSGLASDEFPAILQSGERVLSRKQVTEQESQQQAPMFVFNVQNDTGNPVKLEQSMARWDGDKWIIGVVLKNINENGALGRLLAQMAQRK